MDAVYEEINRDLLHFIAKAPSVFHAVNSIRTALSYAGFTEIREEDPWQIERGGKYVVTRNGSPSWHLPSLKTTVMRSA